MMVTTVINKIMHVFDGFSRSNKGVEFQNDDQKNITIFMAPKSQ